MPHYHRKEKFKCYHVELNCNWLYKTLCVQITQTVSIHNRSNENCILYLKSTLQQLSTTVHTQREGIEGSDEEDAFKDADRTML